MLEVSPMVDHAAAKAHRSKNDNVLYVHSCCGPTSYDLRLTRSLKSSNRSYPHESWLSVGVKDCSLWLVTCKSYCAVALDLISCRSARNLRIMPNICLPYNVHTYYSTLLVLCVQYVCMCTVRILTVLAAGSEPTLYSTVRILTVQYLTRRRTVHIYSKYISSSRARTCREVDAKRYRITEKLAPCLCG